jgi:hypothetical protein
MKTNKYKWLARPASITAALLLPLFSAHAADYNITSYGAVANDSTKDTTAIQNAINAAYNAGGGRVVVPSGTFITGKVTLKNNVTLRLDTSTSVLKGTTNYLDYGSGAWTDSMIDASGGTNKRIEGPGTIDGVNCENPNGEGGWRGPHGVYFMGCDGITFVGFTIKNTGNYALTAWDGWQASDAATKNITVDGVKFYGVQDGLHVNSATNITVKNCNFQTRDDCIAGCDNTTMTVTDCQLNSPANGMRLGVNGLTVKRCRFWGPAQYPTTKGNESAMDAAYKYFSPSDRNPTIVGDNVVFEDCVYETVAHVFAYDRTSGDATGEWQDGKILKNVTIRNITASGIFNGGAIYVDGDTGRQFNLTMEGCEVSSSNSKQCMTIKNYGTVTMKAVTLNSGGSVKGSFTNGNYLKRNRVLPTASSSYVYSSAGTQETIALPFTSGTIFRLTPQHATGKCLDVSGVGTSDGANVHIWTYGGSSNQKWKVTDVTGGGVYELTPQHATSKRLDVSGVGNANGVNVQIWASNGGSGQRWRLLEQGSGIFELTPLCAPYRRLDVSGASTADGANVQIWQDANANQQRWKLQTP